MVLSVIFSDPDILEKTSINLIIGKSPRYKSVVCNLRAFKKLLILWNRKIVIAKA